MVESGEEGQPTKNIYVVFYMNEDEAIAKMEDELLADYYLIDPFVIFTDDLYAETLSVCENPLFLSYIQSLAPAEQAMQRSLNGCYVPPKDIQSKQFILISNKLRKDGYSYISTVAHELQHSINHSEFALTMCNGEFTRIYSHPYLNLFQVWDEFAARRTGHRVFLTFVCPEILGYSREKIVNLILNENKPHFVQEISLLRKGTMSIKLMEEVAGILARFSVWRRYLNIKLDWLDDWSMVFLDNLDCYEQVTDVNFKQLKECLDKLQRTY